MRNHRRHRRLACMISLVSLLAACCLPVSAYSYQYTPEEEAIPAPDGYTVTGQIRADQVVPGASWDPTDLFVDEDGNIHVLDSMDGRIHTFNRDLQYQSSVIFQEDGSEAFLMGITGLYVDGTGDDRTFFVADPDQERVIVADAKGNIIKQIEKPTTGLLDEDVSFSAEKVALDKNGNLYVLVPTLHMGAFVFSAQNDYEFLTFLGSNTVEATPGVVVDYIWKQLFNDRMVANMKRYLPVPFANFDVDEEGYLYTVTNATSGNGQFTDEIKKFNTNNQNILPAQEYGDYEIETVTSGGYVDTSYVDIAVNERGIIAAIDGERCRVAVFSPEGDRLFTFGQRSHTSGSFDTPVAIEMIGDDIYVLDQYFQNVTRFSPTAYGQLVYQAVDHYGNGEYAQAMPYWQDVLRQNGGFTLANQGIGKALLQQGDYRGAMTYFKRGEDRTGYSDAFSLQRGELFQKIFPVIFILMVAGFVLLIWGERRLKHKNSYLINPLHKNLAGRIRYTLFHPCEGGLVLARQTDTRKTMIFTAGTLVVWFIACVVDWQYAGFVFNQNDVQHFEVLTQLLKTFGLFFLFVISGWFVSNLMNSSARLTDLACITAVALIPYIVGILLHAGLSNVLTESEGSFLTILQVLLIVWSVIILLGGLKEVHEMSFMATILSLIFTVIGILLILFLALLVWSLCQNVVSFALQIADEISKMIG